MLMYIVPVMLLLSCGSSPACKAPQANPLIDQVPLQCIVMPHLMLHQLQLALDINTRRNTYCFPKPFELATTINANVDNNLHCRQNS